MIILVTQLDQFAQPVVIHGLNSETNEQVDLPQCRLSEYEDIAKYDPTIDAWVMDEEC